MTAVHIRNSGSVVLNIKKDDPSLKLWSTHSIRVTAANLLHRANLSDSYIKTRLRWKSSSFLMYLRNTIYGADTHTKAINDLHASPVSNLPPHRVPCQPPR